MFGIPLLDLAIAAVGVPLMGVMVWLPHGLGHLLDHLDNRRVHRSKNRDHNRREFER